MRLALVSDLHGNALALEAVLADARGAYDELVCLGDVATLGPRPREVLARLRDLGVRTLLGNHDEFMLDPGLARAYTDAPLVLASIDATRARLTAEDLELIRGFPRTLTLGDVLLFHGTPRSNTEDLLATTPAERVDEMLAGHREPLMAGGHTHLPMVRQHKGCLLVNPGSVGLPFLEPAGGGPPVILAHADYAIVEVDARGARVALRRVALDRRALAAQLDGWDDPLAGSLRAQYA